MISGYAFVARNLKCDAALPATVVRTARPLSFLTNAWGKLFKDSMQKPSEQPAQNFPFMEGPQFHPQPAPGLFQPGGYEQQPRATPRPRSVHPTHHRPLIQPAQNREGHFRPWQASVAPAPPSSVSSDDTPRPTTPPPSSRNSPTPALTGEEYARMMVELFVADNGPVTKEQFGELLQRYKNDFDRLRREERRRTGTFENLRQLADQQEVRTAKGNWSTCPTAAQSHNGRSRMQARRAARVWEYLNTEKFQGITGEEDAAQTQIKERRQQQETPPATVPPVPPSTPFRDPTCHIPIFFDAGLTRTTFDIPTTKCPYCDSLNVEAINNNSSPAHLLNSQRHPDSGALILYCPDSEAPRTALSIYLATIRNDRDPLAGQPITSTNWHLVLAYLVYITSQSPSASPPQTRQATQLAHSWADSALPTDATALDSLGPAATAALLYATAQSRMPLHWASVARAALLNCRADADASLVDAGPSPRPLWLHLPADDVLREAVRDLCRVLRTPRQECMGLTCAEVLETRRALRRRAREGSESAREQREALRGRLVDVGLWPRRGEAGYHQLVGVIVKSSVVEVRQRVQMAVRALEPARRRDLEMLGIRVDRIVDSVHVPSLDEMLRTVADARTRMSVHF
ncbi:hypothetical protein PpBr36_05561 [Pyricularia pennisetigena]|uniref:hypothetical protein n=1 Tax=Pyricularia pennisetigena TaxID=1578925 RepID=UPI00115450CB|nr:hypothetical protein PpBr36_05561 [Pyricularia pennisetigena]TLS27183.1 hypothetical protein PpBr36_05561 [Pyricularia pennisetigena]